MGLPAPYTVLRPTAVRRGDNTSYQALPCLVVLQWAMALFSGDAKPLAWIFDGVLTVWVPILLSLIWNTLFLPVHAYPMSESSYHLCVYPWSSCQKVMGRILALKCRLSSARGFLRPCPISSGNKYYRLQRPRCW
jgi:hypothetical protein